MADIVQKTIFLVGAKQFDTINEAETYVADEKKFVQIASTFFDYSDFNSDDSETAARCLVQQWERIAGIMGTKPE
jgi:hypothetical protein